MKTNDLIGFGAILVAGFVAGEDYEVGDFATFDLILIAALLAAGYYFAVYLS